jgi:hypothetical protein
MTGAVHKGQSLSEVVQNPSTPVLRRVAIGFQTPVF